MADTGDIEHGPGHCITVFKTPGTFTVTPKLTQHLNAIVDQACALSDLNTGQASARALAEVMRDSRTRFISARVDSWANGVMPRVPQLVGLGYKSAAMDIEFMRLDKPEEE